MPTPGIVVFEAREIVVIIETAEDIFVAGVEAPDDIIQIVLGSCGVREELERENRKQ